MEERRGKKWSEMKQERLGRLETLDKVRHLSASAWKILHVLIDQMFMWECQVPRHRIKERTGYSLKTISLAITELHKAGFIYRTERYAPDDSCKQIASRIKALPQLIGLIRPEALKPVKAPRKKKEKTPAPVTESGNSSVGGTPVPKSGNSRYLSEYRENCKVITPIEDIVVNENYLSESVATSNSLVPPDAVQPRPTTSTKEFSINQEITEKQKEKVKSNSSLADKAATAASARNPGEDSDPIQDIYAQYRVIVNMTRPDYPAYATCPRNDRPIIEAALKQINVSLLSIDEFWKWLPNALIESKARLPRPGVKAVFELMLKDFIRTKGNQFMGKNVSATIEAAAISGIPIDMARLPNEGAIMTLLGSLRKHGIDVQDYFRWITSSEYWIDHEDYQTFSYAVSAKAYYHFEGQGGIKRIFQNKRMDIVQNVYDLLMSCHPCEEVNALLEDGEWAGTNTPVLFLSRCIRHIESSGKGVSFAKDIERYWRD